MESTPPLRLIPCDKGRLILRAALIVGGRTINEHIVAGDIMWLFRRVAWHWVGQ